MRGILCDSDGLEGERSFNFNLEARHNSDTATQRRPTSKRKLNGAMPSRPSESERMPLVKMTAQEKEDYEMDVLYKGMVMSGRCFHYKAMAECFPDGLQALNLMIEGGHKCIKVNITSDMFGETYIDFWTMTPMADLQRLWEEEGIDLHSLYQTITEIKSN